jgi:raffinose/stachyose/melibiose transport system permease protein
MSVKRKRAFAAFWLSLLSLCVASVHLVPIWISAMAALRRRSDLSSLWFPPAAPEWANFFRAVRSADLPRAFLNTFLITFGATALTVLLGAMAAYPLARNRSRRNEAVKIFTLSIMMVPALSLLVPLYSLLVGWGAISTLWGVVPVHVTFNLPIAIFLYTNFVRAIPRELDEAAIIDGCSVFRVFDRIVLPLLKPVTVSVIILTGVSVWNDYQFSVYFLQRPAVRVVTLAIASFFGQTSSDPNVAAAAALLAVLPVMSLYILLQKHFVKGTVDSALK